MRKVLFENPGKFTEKHLRFVKYSRTPFLQNIYVTATSLKSSSANSVRKTLDNTLDLETLALKVLLCISFLSQQHKLLVHVFIGLHCLLSERTTRVEVFCKKQCS